MWDSGTPFCMSSSIAWLAELPSKEEDIGSNSISFLSTGVAKEHNNSSAGEGPGKRIK